EAGDAPRWHHDGGSEPTDETLDPLGYLNLETGVPEKTQAALAELGWRLKPNPGVYGGYQAIQAWPGRYAAATQMRKDGGGAPPYGPLRRTPGWGPPGGPPPHRASPRAVSVRGPRRRCTRCITTASSSPCRSRWRSSDRGPRSTSSAACARTSAAPSACGW